MMPRGNWPGRERHEVERNRATSGHGDISSTDCLYCTKPIEPGQDIVRGVEAVAHRMCVHDRLDRDCPGWRSQIDPPQGRGRLGRNKLRGSYKKADKVPGLSRTAFR